MGDRSTLRLTMPRTSASLSAPRITVWIRARSYATAADCSRSACPCGCRGFWVVGCKPPDLRRAERWQDVEMHDPLVAVECGRRKVDLLGGQPPLRQVRTEGQAPVPIVTPDGLLGDFAASRSAASRSVPAACQVRCSRPVTGSSPLQMTVYQRLPLRARYPSMTGVLLLSAPSIGKRYKNCQKRCVCRVALFAVVAGRLALLTVGPFWSIGADDGVRTRSDPPLPSRLRYPIDRCRRLGSVSGTSTFAEDFPHLHLAIAKPLLHLGISARDVLLGDRAPQRFALPVDDRIHLAGLSRWSYNSFLMNLGRTSHDVRRHPGPAAPPRPASRLWTEHRSEDIDVATDLFLSVRGWFFGVLTWSHLDRAAAWDDHQRD